MEKVYYIHFHTKPYIFTLLDKKTKQTFEEETELVRYFVKYGPLIFKKDLYKEFNDKNVKDKVRMLYIEEKDKNKLKDLNAYADKLTNNYIEKNILPFWKRKYGNIEIQSFEEAK